MVKFVQSNLWQDTCKKPTQYPTLEEDISVDMAVIGAGFTGLSAALHFRENKTSVAVLETHNIGHGGSGRNVGLVNAGLWLKPDEIIERAGPDYGERLIHFLGKAPQQVFSTINKYQIECEAHHNGTLHCADTIKGRDELKQRQEQWGKFGVDIDLIDKETTARLMGTSEYCAALHDMRAGSIQPLDYAYGLAKAAADLGANIYCNSPVLSVTRKGDNWSIKTPKGHVRAKKIISATGAYDYQDKDRFSPDMTALYYFQMATAPLSDELQKTILPEKHGTWDTHQILTSFRMNDEGRLIIGSIGHLDKLSYQTHKAWAYRKMRKIYPQLHNQTFTHEWYGRIGLTSSNIPRLAKPHADWVTIWGYNGRGIAPGTVFGRLLAEMHLNEHSIESPLPIVELQTDKFINSQSFAIELGACLYHTGSARF